MRLIATLVLTIASTFALNSFAATGNCSLKTVCQYGSAVCLAEASFGNQAVCGVHQTWAFCGVRPTSSVEAEDIDWEKTHIVCCDKSGNTVSGVLGRIALSTVCAKPGKINSDQKP